MKKRIRSENNTIEMIVRLRIEQHFCCSEVVVGEEAELQAIEGIES